MEIIRKAKVTRKIYKIMKRVNKKLCPACIQYCQANPRLPLSSIEKIHPECYDLLKPEIRELNEVVRK